MNEFFYSYDFILFLFGLPAVFKIGLSLSQCRAARAVPVAVQPRARFTSRIGLVWNLWKDSNTAGIFLRFQFTLQKRISSSWYIILFHFCLFCLFDFIYYALGSSTRLVTSCNPFMACLLQLSPYGYTRQFCHPASPENSKLCCKTHSFVHVTRKPTIQSERADTQHLSWKNFAGFPF